MLGETWSAGRREDGGGMELLLGVKLMVMMATILKILKKIVYFK